MLASLPMYDLPELAQATDSWWQGLRRHFAAQGIAGLPANLTPIADPIMHWQQAAPIFSQTCGYPLTHALQGRVRLLATPRYAAPGCAGTSYVSWIVVRRDEAAQKLADLSGRRVAFNGRDSQSGYNVLRSLVAPIATRGRFFGACVESGSHRRSMAMVKSGEADLATIDCVSFALIARAALQSRQSRDPRPLLRFAVRMCCAWAPDLALRANPGMGDCLSLWRRLTYLTFKANIFQRRSSWAPGRGGTRNLEASRRKASLLRPWRAHAARKRSPMRRA